MEWTHYDKDGRHTGYLGRHLIPHLRSYKKPDLTELAGNALFKVTGNKLQLSKKSQWRFVHLNRIFEQITKQYRRTLYVYANVGKSTVVGDQVVDLLREVEYEPSQLDMVHFEPNIIQYHDVFSSDMEILEVQITESDNTPIDFGTGNTTLVLHFKKE